MYAGENGSPIPIAATNSETKKPGDFIDDTAGRVTSCRWSEYGLPLPAAVRRHRHSIYGCVDVGVVRNATGGG